MTDQVRDGVVVAIDYVMRLANGEAVDSTEGDAPMEILQGAGEIVPGLEKALYGMRAGDSKTVVVTPDEGFGRYQSDNRLVVPRGEFPDDIDLEPGTGIYVQSDDEEEPLDAYIVSADEENVVLDLNHPLADETLHIDVTVRSLREATPEEIAHGHAHGEDDEDEWDDEDWDEDEEWDEDDELEEDEEDEEDEQGGAEPDVENGRAG
jgi:FKBP-type peptidyl-prolyl cis-trans isomerase SlyD